MEHIVFNKEITDQSLTDLLFSLRSIEVPQNVYINSPGGVLNRLPALVPVIEGRKIVTLGGSVGSAAIVLFMLGHERYIFEDSDFIFHSPSFSNSIFGDWSETEVQRILSSKEISLEMSILFKQWVRDVRNMESWLLNFLNEKTGVSKEIFLRLMRDETRISAIDAVKYGIAHKILPREILL